MNELEKQIEILHVSERTRVFRWTHATPDGPASVICKEPVGPHALGRLRHETAILQRLSSLKGVPRLAASAAPPGALLALVDSGARALTPATRERFRRPGDWIALALRLTAIVGDLHRVGIMHSDIHPGNLLFEGEHPVLIDFDLAWTFGKGESLFPESELAGTFAYLAPEQTGRSGRSVDHRADLYGLGATLYELLTGQPPFECSDPLQLLHEILTRAPIAPTSIDPGLPAALSEIVMRLLEKEPDSRYQSAEGLSYDLLELQGALVTGRHSFTLGARDFPLRLASPDRLIGRSAEVAVLKASLDSLGSGRARGLLVTGQAGVGKTALVEHLKGLVARRGGRYISGKFFQFRGDVAKGALHQAFTALGRLLLAEPEKMLQAKRARLLGALGPEAGLMAAIVKEFAILLDVPPEPTDDDPLASEPRVRKGGLALLRAVASQERPLVLVLEDLQWAEAPVLGFVEEILTDESMSGILLVANYRDHEVGPDHPLSGVLARWEQLGLAPRKVSLDNLTEHGLTELLAEMLRMPVSEAARLAAVLTEMTAGNPYETVELINALRAAGILTSHQGGFPLEGGGGGGPRGWVWDEAKIRAYIGSGEVADVVSARIASLPPEARRLLELSACLGGRLELDLLRLAADLSPSELEARLGPLLEVGLLVKGSDFPIQVSFRHDRIQQAAYSGLHTRARVELHLRIARRLSLVGRESEAAAQFLPAVAAVEDVEERALVARLLREAAAAAARNGNFASAERSLAAAIGLLPAGDDGLCELETHWHGALFCQGRHEDADRVFASIMARGQPPEVLTEAVAIQVGSLCNRGRAREAVALGVAHLDRLSLRVPAAENLADEVTARLPGLYAWVSRLETETDLPDLTDPGLLAVARLVNRMMPPAFFSDPTMVAWLALESQRLWSNHGPCASLVGLLCHSGLVLAGRFQDYRSSYRVMRHALAVGETRFTEADTSVARFIFACTAQHWFEPLEQVLAQAQLAREGLLRSSDLQFACFTYSVTLPVLLDLGPTLTNFAAELEQALNFAKRTGKHHSISSFVVHSRLLAALHDESIPRADPEDSPMATAVLHIYAALAGLLYEDVEALKNHANAAMQGLKLIEASYRTALAYLFRALALAQEVRETRLARGDVAVCLARLDEHRDWLARRASDEPGNFSHLLDWVEAERAWALDERWQAALAFDAALRAVESRQRPWHRAAITERAGLFQIQNGLEQGGRTLLIRARRLYDEWGATGKVRQLDRRHAFVRGSLLSSPTRGRAISSDAIDLLAILRASQALSSETNLAGLQSRVEEVLGALTGATSVRILLRVDGSEDAWVARAPGQPDEPAVGLEAVFEAGLVARSAFRYVERTREPLVVADAPSDDRFARDPYFAGLDRCSLLVVPVLSSGSLRAALWLENRLTRGAFSVDRLDAVLLITGQLGVSLDNAMLYASLERKVNERTEALASSLSLVQATLNSTTDGILVTDEHGQITDFNGKFLQLWNLPSDASPLRGAASLAFEKQWLERALPQLEEPSPSRPWQLVMSSQELLSFGELESQDTLRFRDGRVYERYSTPRRIEERTVGRVWSFRDVTQRERARVELEQAHHQLMAASRLGGMAEVATNVLHNVGNALNSVNVSANLVAERVRRSRVSKLGQLSQLLLDHEDDLSDFLTVHASGKAVPGYLAQLSEHLLAEQAATAAELESLRSNVDHIKEIVKMQQANARASGVLETVTIEELVETSLRLHGGSPTEGGGGAHCETEIVRELAEVPRLTVDKHKVLQVLVNLLGNANWACKQAGEPPPDMQHPPGLIQRAQPDMQHPHGLIQKAHPDMQHPHGLIQKAHPRILLRVTSGSGFVRISVADNGIGIAAENLTRIFSHGFTMREGGHGFGLHAGALAAREMGGSLSVTSTGLGAGATFTLELPHPEARPPAEARPG